MYQFHYRIKDELGLHARPAGLLAKESQKHTSRINVEKNGKKADCRKLIALMSLGIKKDDEIIVTVEGDEEQCDGPAMRKFFQDNL